MWIIALALLAADPGLWREPGKKHPFLTPSEIVKRLDASERTYNIHKEEAPEAQWYLQNAQLTWHAGAGMAVPVRTNDGVVEWNAPAGSAELMDKADALFHQKDFKAAEAAYALVLVRYPSHYLAMVAWGECAELTGRRDVALERYEKAGAFAPYDYRSWYHRGNALLELGRKAEATKMYVHALALSPRSDELLDGIEGRQPKLGFRLHRNLFVPAARIEKKGDEVLMSLVAQPQWVAWAGCKALWMGERSHREEMTGHGQHVFTNVEEEECLMNLAASYETVTKAKEGYEKDPTSQLVFDVSQAHLLTEFVMFEIGSRVDPQVTLRLPEEYLPRIEELIRKYVLVPAK
jgi:tetratricopeptide (TPR) repeat protein